MQKVNTFKSKGIAMILIMALIFTIVPSTSVFADGSHYDYDGSQKFTYDGKDYYYVIVNSDDIGSDDIEIAFSGSDGEAQATQIGATDVYYAAKDPAVTMPNISKYLYGCANIEYPDYWKNEGLSAPSKENWTAVSDKIDSEGFKDMGGFDTVSRATTKHGTYRGAFQFIMDIYGYKIDDPNKTLEKFVSEHDPDINGTRVPPVTSRAITSVPVENVVSMDDLTTTFASFNGDVYKYDHYEIRGIQRVPVKVSEKTYVENLILKEADKEYIKNIDDFRLGGQDGSNTVVTNKTGGMKELLSNGEYGPISPGVQTSERSVVVENKETTAINYNHKFGEYAEAQIGLKNKDGSEFDTYDLLHYLTKFTSATYIYYGNDDTYTKPVATYGSMGTTDTWWSTNHGARIDAGFMFDSYRLGSPDGKTKNKQFGNWRVIFRSAGYEDLIADFDLKPEVSFEKSSVTLKIGESKSIAANIKDLMNSKGQQQKTVKYTSSNEKVAKVDDTGTVTAIGSGTTKIKVDVNKDTKGDLHESAEYTLTVTDPNVATSIILDKKAATLYRGVKNKNKVTIKATVNGNDKIVQWDSSNSKVASVKNGVVTGKKKGKAVITAKANGKSVSAVITVKNPTYKVNKTKLNLKKGKKFKLKITKKVPSGKVSFKSKNKRIVSVNSKGVIRAKKKGTTRITIKCNGVTKSVKVRVR